MALPRSSSPTASLRSTHSFLDEDPYPSGGLRRTVSALSLAHPAHSTPAHEPHLTNSTLLNRLESLLRAKAEEVQLAGQLGQALLSQQTELENRIREIAEVSARYAASTPGGSGEGEESSDGEKEIGEETRQKLRALEQDLEGWEGANSDMYQVVGQAAQKGVPTIDQLQQPAVSPSDASADPDYPSASSSSVFDSPLDSAGGFQDPNSAPTASRRRAPSLSGTHPRDLSASLSATTSSADANSASASRRARNNTQHRNNDIELATEIGQSLLVEVRRLQALLQEKDEQLQGSMKDRDAMALEVESAVQARKTVEESVEKYKEVNWELELASQDLRNSLAASQAALSKVEIDRSRFVKDLASTRDALEAQRSEAEKLAQQVEALKAKHETDMANMRKTTAGLQRDKSDLQGTLEGLKTELATRSRAIRRGSPAPGTPVYRGDGNGFDDEDEFDASPNDDDPFRSTNRRKTGEGFPSAAGHGTDVFGEGDSPAASPIQRPGFPPVNEVEGMRANLAHAQRQLATLRTSLAREKQAKLELRKQPVEAGRASWEDEEDSDDDDVLGTGTPAKQLGVTMPRSARGSVRGSARGRGSAVRRGGAGGSVRAPSRLAREYATGVSEDEGEEVDSFDQPDGASIFEHPNFRGGDAASESGTEGGFDSPTRDLGASTRSRSTQAAKRASVASVDSIDPIFAHQFERARSPDADSIRSGEDGPSFLSSEGGVNGRTTLADVLGEASPRSSLMDGHHRSASVNSLASLVKGSTLGGAGMDAVEETEEKDVKPAVAWNDASTMTDFPPPPTPEPITIVKEVLVPAPTPEPITIVKEVVKEVYIPAPVPEPVIITKEVIKEVIKEVVVPGPAPEPITIVKEVPGPAPEPITIIKEVIKEVLVPALTPEPVIVTKEVIKEVLVPAPVPEAVTVYVDAPKPEVSHVAVQATPEPEPVVAVAPPLPSPAMADFAGQTDPEERPVEIEKREAATSTDAAVEIEKKEMAISTDPAPPTAHRAVSTDAPASQPILSSMEVQTDPLLEPEVDFNTLTPIPVAAARMEDRALASQPSLSALNGYGVPPERDETITTLAALQGFHRATTPNSTHSDSDFGSETTDRAPYYTDTETDGEFEDARESLGGAFSPALGPRASISGSTRTGSTGLDFVSVRSARTTAFGDREDEEEAEVLAGREGDNFRRTLRGRPSDYSAWSAVQEQLKPETAEMEIQTDRFEPPVEVQVKTVYVDKVVYVDKPVYVDNIVYVDRPLPSTAATERASSTTPPDELDESAARASAFLGEGGDSAALEWQPNTPTPQDSLFSSTRTEDTVKGAPVLGDVKGKGKEVASGAGTAGLVMGPPPVPQPARKTGSPRKSGASSASARSLRQQPPPRPTSPPPADLLFRAQSPSFDDDYARKSSAFLAPPGGNPALRSQPSGLSTTPSSSRFVGPFTNLKQVRPQASMDTSVSHGNQRSTRKGHSSSARSVSELSMHSDVSRRMSMASEATSDGAFEAPHPPMRGAGDSTDPAVIHAITQTMIGEFVFKYTRRKLGSGMSENRHKRFFWLHPYTKTLYWSAADPGAQTTTYSSSKSAYIEGVRQVLDPNPFPPGLHQNSIIVKTRDREMKFTAGTKERHDMWFAAINYLIARPEGPAPGTTPSSATSTPNSRKLASNPTPRAGPTRMRSRTLAAEDPNDFFGVPNQVYSLGASVSDSRLTPKAYSRTTGRGSVGGSSTKRAGTVADEYTRRTMYGSPASVRTFSDYGGHDPADGSLEVVDRNEIPPGIGDDDDDEFEGLENVRACCNGKHDVGSLSRRHHHHHHSHSHSDIESRSGTPAPPTPSRARSKSSTNTLGSISRRMAAIPSPRKSLSRKSSHGGGSVRPLSPLPVNGDAGTIGRRTPVPQ
ncbi:hypothetical protein JCM1841_007026 [Sporobolomyces salmonicolor]